MKTKSSNARNICFVIAFFALTALCFSSCQDNGLNNDDKIFAIMKNSDPYWKQIARGVQDEAKAKGLEAEIFFGVNENDPIAPLNKLASINFNKYKGIIIGPALPLSMVAIIEDIASKLPVVIVDTHLGSTNSACRAFIGTDNKSAGANFSQTFKDKVIGSATNILALRLTNSPAIAQRIEGFVDAMDKKINITVIDVPNESVDALAKIKGAMSTMSGPYAIFAANGTTANWALQVMASLNSDVKLGVFDVTSEVLRALKSGKVKVICAQDTHGMGSEAVNAILDQTVLKERFLPTKEIDINNVNSPGVAPYLKGIK